MIDPVSEFIAQLQNAVRNDDSDAVAAMVAFPLRVRVDGERRTYRSADQIVDDYDRIFTPAVRSAVLGLRSNTVRSRDQGRLHGNSRIWFGCGRSDCSSASSITIREVMP